MEGLTAAAGVLCVSVFVVGILYEMGCFVATAKIIRFVTAIIITITVLKSFNSIDKIKIKTENYSDIYSNTYQQNLNEMIIENTRHELEKIIKRRLEEKNISYKSVEVHILEQNGNVTVDTIYIDCDKKAQTAVRQCIQDILAEDAKLVIGE